MIETEDPNPHIESASSKVLRVGFVIIAFAGYIGLDVLTPCCFDIL